VSSLAATNYEKKKMFETKKTDGLAQITLLPRHTYVLTSAARWIWNICNLGAGQVHAEGHTPLPGPSADLVCVSAEGALLSAGDIVVFSGSGAITLDSVDDEGAVVTVEVMKA
jgi:hypothetical protein